MFKVLDIQKKFGVSEATVLAWVNSGQLLAMNVGTNPGGLRPLWRITQAAVDAFEAARTATAPTPRARRAKSPGDVVNFY